MPPIRNRPTITSCPSWTSPCRGSCCARPTAPNSTRTSSKTSITLPRWPLGGRWSVPHDRSVRPQGQDDPGQANQHLESPPTRAEKVCSDCAQHWQSGPEEANHRVPCLGTDRKSTRLNSSLLGISYAV